ncbi:MAG: carbohydrate-binding family 9-like protein [Edaphobacter sp.]|uniref:carbohydrate-binding family 9-like protein n=1 Tax=Edaphobacter sp. TaxID=1934404 RepID=UPI00239C35C8|nr:carbohydrate-binding family 9-like protein [Edaphobacter sp.]MDE1175772.1 carbohydrate-binding family 9-like protein [Edaphobacter sp.]
MADVGGSLKEMSAVYAPEDVPLCTDAESSFWKQTLPVFFCTDNYGRAIEGDATQVFARWTHGSLYLLSACPYRELWLKPDPQTACATPQLWEWDVAELFIGCDAESARHYKEFEISPQAEWLDLDVDLEAPGRTRDAQWASGFEVKSTVDQERSIWYGSMRIPFEALGVSCPKVGDRWRINLLRSQGPEHQLLAWQPSMSETFHVPERFGELVLKSL